jgi:hypothetical protein
MFDKKEILIVGIQKDNNSSMKFQHFELYDYSIEKIIEFIDLIDTLEGMEG